MGAAIDAPQSNANRVFATEATVRFGDCDLAGIVFYRCYFEISNNLVEDWCAQALSMVFGKST